MIVKIGVNRFGSIGHPVITAASTLATCILLPSMTPSLTSVGKVLAKQGQEFSSPNPTSVSGKCGSLLVFQPQKAETENPWCKVANYTSYTSGLQIQLRVYVSMKRCKVKDIRTHLHVHVASHLKTHIQTHR